MHFGFLSGSPLRGFEKSILLPTFIQALFRGGVYAPFFHDVRLRKGGRLLRNVAVHESVSAFVEEVRVGLTRSGQKELPSKYLYDTVGSALFEVISVLPEYGLTRADERLLRRHAGEIANRLPKPILVAELGCGSGKKTRWILEARLPPTDSLSSDRNLFRGPGDVPPRTWKH